MAKAKKKFFFIDEGLKLPSFFKFWKHHHRIVKNTTGCVIIDDITFKSANLLLDYLLFFQGCYLQFLYRVPIYKRIFSKE